MARTALLNNVDHAGLKVVTRHSAAFGDNVNQTLIFPTEFAEVQREYPILLRKDANGAFQAVALLGLDKDENLFLGENGWEARYIPAVIERGPFMIGFQNREENGETRREPMVLVDLDHPRVSESEGEPVFLPHGGNTPYLERITDILRLIHEGVEVSQPVYTLFDELGLIEPVAIEISLSDREKYSVPDCYTIGQDKLAQLEGGALERLHKTGFLPYAIFILSSLGNMGRLIALKNRKRGAF